MNKLKELDPAKINWFKENDVTVLYGPLIIEDEDAIKRRETIVESEDDEDEDNEEEDDELFNRRNRLSSQSSYSSQGSDGKPLKSILKKNNNINKCSSFKRYPHRKRISFSDELLISC